MEIIAQVVGALGILTNALMVTYDALSGSYAGLLNEAISVTSTVIGIIRLDIKKKNEKVLEKAETEPPEKKRKKRDKNKIPPVRAVFFIILLRL